MEEAVQIGQSYLEQFGAMPLMVVALDDKRENHTWLGNFRKKHEREDQKTFCGVLRLAFAAKRIQSYTLLLNANMQLGGIESNVLIATNIQRDGKQAKIFEIVDANTLKQVMEIDTANLGQMLEGMYLELLPLRYNAIGEETATSLDAHLKAITYTPPKAAEEIKVLPETERDELEDLMDEFFN